MNFFKFYRLLHKGTVCGFYQCNYKRKCRRYSFNGVFSCLDCALFYHPCKTCVYNEDKVSCTLMRRSSGVRVDE